MNNICISIIIPVKNGQKYLDSVLKAIFSQEINAKFEVIIIDSGSCDKTLEIIKRYPVNLIQIPPQEFGHGKTRNFGANLARGKYVVFLNADAIPKNKYWLCNLLTHFSSYNKVAGVYSRIYPQENCNPLDARDIWEDKYLFDQKEKYIRSIYEFNQMNPEAKRKFVSFHTISCAIDRALLLENPFDDIKFGEDLTWAKRILEKGFKIIFESSSEVIHSHNLHCSFIQTTKRYFDDARLNQIILNRWHFSNLLKWPAVIAIESMKDAIYILRLKRNSFYKLIWMFYSPFIRVAEFLGILLGALPSLPPRLAHRLSLVEQIKQQ